MELFTIIYPIDKEIYKGSEYKILRETTNNNPMWFAELEVSKRYGKFTHIYRTKNELKLIDITSGIFHQDFMTKVNRFFSKDSLSLNKARILAPLGLPDFETQQFYTRKVDMSRMDERLKHYILDNLPFFNNKNRYSTYELDINMTNMIKLLYPSFDGYVSEIPLPSLFHEGMFNPEICIFNSNKDLSYYGMLPYLSGGKKNKNNHNIYLFYQPEKMYWNMYEYKLYKKKINKLNKLNKQKKTTLSESPTKSFRDFGERFGNNNNYNNDNNHCISCEYKNMPRGIELSPMEYEKILRVGDRI